MYRTGDGPVGGKTGKWNSLADRISRSSFRGYRIELAEIEAALTNCAGVAQRR